MSCCKVASCTFGVFFGGLFDVCTILLFFESIRFLDVERVDVLQVGRRHVITAELHEVYDVLVAVSRKDAQ